MIKAGDVVGRPVISRDGGQQVGKIKDVVVDDTGRKVVAFEVDEGLLRAGRLFEWNALQVIGPDSVIIDSGASVVKASRLPEIKAMLSKGTALKGLKLQTTEGKALGKIEDFVFDETSGEVGGYELSGGFLADTYTGRTFLPTPDTIELGKEVAFISPEAAATISQQEGGLKGALRWPGKPGEEQAAPSAARVGGSDDVSGDAPAAQPDLPAGEGEPPVVTADPGSPS